MLFHKASTIQITLLRYKGHIVLSSSTVTFHGYYIADKLLQWRSSTISNSNELFSWIPWSKVLVHSRVFLFIPYNSNTLLFGPKFCSIFFSVSTFVCILCPFTFGCCIICPLNYGLWLPLWYLYILSSTQRLYLFLWLIDWFIDWCLTSSSSIYFMHIQDKNKFNNI